MIDNIQLDNIDKSNLLYNNGIFVHEKYVFSPDCLYIDDENNIIHIFEFKSPISRKPDINLYNNYFHQLNYSAFVLIQILQEKNLIFNEDYTIKLHFLAVKFNIVDDNLIYFDINNKNPSYTHG